MKYVVIGGAGAMGRIAVRDLLETASPRDAIVIADYDALKARALARALGDPRARPQKLDVHDPGACARSLKGAFALINAAHYQLNLQVMRAALAVRAHYVDLGGLFHMTRRQLGLDADFKRAGRAALLGMGAAPGITNVLARRAAEGLERVREIHARVASADLTRYRARPALAVSYSLKTILEEFSMRPAVFTKGRLRFVAPMSGDAPHPFPPPIGTARPMHTLHSEVATLPLSFKDRGVREVSFKIAFDPEFLDRVRFLRDLGFASHDPLEVGGERVKPIDVANALAMSQPPARARGALKQCEVVRAVVKGRRGGEAWTVIADCRTEGMPRWGIGLDIDTGAPPSIAAQMLAAGEIRATGVLAPEAAVPPEPFFKHLARRGMRVSLKRLRGWAFPT